MKPGDLVIGVYHETAGLRFFPSAIGLLIEIYEDLDRVLDRVRCVVLVNGEMVNYPIKVLRNVDESH